MGGGVSPSELRQPPPPPKLLFCKNRHDTGKNIFVGLDLHFQFVSNINYGVLVEKIVCHYAITNVPNFIFRGIYIPSASPNATQKLIASCLSAFYKIPPLYNFIVHCFDWHVPGSILAPRKIYDVNLYCA